MNQNTGASDEGVQQDVDTTTSTGQLDDASNFEPGIVTNDSPVQEPQITDAAPASETTSETSQLTDEEMGGENAADLDW